MRIKRLISGLLASLMLMGSVNVANASELNQVLEAGKDGNSLLYVNQEVTDFKVVVPLNLPITMDRYGKTVAANNAYIINKSYGPIKVIDVDVDGANGWEIVGYGDDYSKMKVGSQKVGMFIQNDISLSDGTFGFQEDSWNTIAGQGGTHEVAYNGRIPAQYKALEGEQVANAVFTFDWDTTEDVEGVGLFARAIGMTMQEFVDNGYAEESKAYDSYGNEIENWEEHWEANWSRLTLKDKTITELPTNIPVIANQTVITNISGLFSSCTNLTSLDLSDFDTSNITNMYGMFEGCSALINLNVSGLDTSKVINMSYMFMGCSALTSLDVSNFDTSNANYVTGMFNGCSALTSLDVSNFDISSAKNTQSMFANCSALTNLNVSGLDTSNITSMRSMFDACDSLTSLDLSNFDTRNVTNMSRMFAYCHSLTTIYVSENWTTENADTTDMFTLCGTSEVTVK